MDKRTATLTLTEKLQQMGYVNIVHDDVLKSYFLEKAKSVVLDFGYSKSQIVDFKGIDISSERNIEITLSDFKTKFPKANYLFAKEKMITQGAVSCRNLITPAAIIGEAEERILKKECYKDVLYDIHNALEVLDIPNFIEIYDIYLSLKDDNIDFKELSGQKDSSIMYRPFKKEDTIGIGDIIQGYESKKYYLVKEIQKDGIKGPRFLDDQLNTLDENDSNCPNKYINPIYKFYPIILLEFMKFVLTLPKEEQNININEKILKSLPNSNILTEILRNEYLKGENFTKYFNAVNENAQKETINDFKSIQERNSSYDSFLWDKGFKEVNLDYMRLYKKDYQEFIEYFRNKKQDEKKTILKSIMNCDYTNEDVASWLHENEIELLREVSMDG